MIKNYNKFLFKMICESVLLTDNQFISLLKKMQKNIIADALIDFIEKKLDIKTNYNGIGLSDKNDEISFIPDTQFQRFLSSGQDPWTKNKSQSKIGRMVRQILNDNGNGMIKDVYIEEFVNLFKSTWDKENSTTRKIEIVKGDDILYWYNETNYFDLSGTLGNSCMRFPSKNNFMQIYAKNPDKISMVILTENGKLLSRSLLWKLEYSSNGYKFLLDRIYTRNDSDFKFVQRWVIDNIVKNESDLGSFQNGNIGVVRCKLDNVEFDKYPYADTFRFLYKKIIDGKIIGGGFASNDSKFKDDSLELLRSEIQSTDGGEEIYTHRFSTHIDAYIPIEEAVYIESIGTYMYKKDAKYSRYANSYYIDGDILFSDSMQDWIPKRYVINNNKFGIIGQGCLINAISEYLGSESNPIEISNEFIGGIDLFKMEEYVDTKDPELNKYFKSYGSPRYSYRLFDKKFMVDDLHGRSYSKLFCFKLFEIDGSIEKNILNNMGHASANYKKYICEIDAKFYNIKIKSDFIYMYYTEYISYTSEKFFFQYKKYINKADLDEDIKRDHMEHTKSIHNYKYNEDPYYRQTINILEKLDEKEISIEELMLSAVSASINKVISDYGIDQIDKKIKYRISEYKINIGDDDVLLIRKLIKPYFLFYLLTEDSSDAETYLRKHISNFDKELSNTIKEKYTESNIDICRYTKIFFNSELRTYARREFEENINKMKDDLGLSISGGDFMYYIIRLCDISNISELDIL